MLALDENINGVFSIEVPQIIYLNEINCGMIFFRKYTKQYLVNDGVASGTKELRGFKI